MVPHTADGRVMFAIPWHGHTLVGTTDTPVDDAALEPRPPDAEIDFVLETAAQYLAKAADARDVLSAFAGIRPLVRAGDSRITARALARPHHSCRSVGAADHHRRQVDHLPPHGRGHGRSGGAASAPADQGLCHPHAARPWRHSGGRTPTGPLAIYGSDAAEVAAIMRTEPDLAEPLHADLGVSGAEVIWAARAEMARTVEDVLSRRLPRAAAQRAGGNRNGAAGGRTPRPRAAPG